MLVQCEICYKHFKVITHRHVKTHNLTIEQYITTFPHAHIYCDEYLENLKQYGQSLKGTHRSDEIKNKISSTMKNLYANNERVKSSLGKRQSHETIEKRKRSKQQNRQKVQIIPKINGRQVRSDNAKHDLHEFLSTCKLQLQQRLHNDHIIVKCLTCGTEFDRTIHIFRKSRRIEYDGQYCPTCFPAMKISGGGNTGHYNISYFTTFPEHKAKPSKLYVIKMYNNDEQFLKIGVTVGVVSRRFALKGKYTMEIIKTVELPLYQAWIIEQAIMKKFTRYRPMHKFGGISECKHINDIHNVISFITESIDATKKEKFE